MAGHFPSEIRGKALPDNWGHCDEERAKFEVENGGAVLVKARVFWSNRHFSHRHTASGYEDFFLYRDEEGFEWYEPGFPQSRPLLPWNNGNMEIEFFRPYEVEE